MPKICGDCGNRFDTVAHVKACYGVEDTQTSPKETLTPTKNIPIIDPVKKKPVKKRPVKKRPDQKIPVSELKNVYATESSKLAFHSTKTCSSLVQGQKK